MFRLLRESDEALDFFESVSVDGIWFWSAEHPHDEWMSRGFWQTVGFDPDEPGGLPVHWRELAFADDLEASRVAFERHCAAPSHPYDATVRFRHADGSTVWIRCRGVVIRDEHGTPLRMLGTHTDVTPLARSEERLRAFVAAMPGIARVFDEDGHYVDVMTTRERLPTLQPDTGLGRHVTEFLPPEAAEAIQSAIQGALELGEPVTFEYSRPTATGALAWFEGRVAPFAIWQPTQRRTVILLAHEVSDRKRAEIELRRKNDELRQFSFIAAHDLKSPVLAIERIAGWLEEDLAEHLGDEQREHFRLIRKRSARIQSLLAGLLDYARTAERVRPTDVDIRDIVRAAADLALPAVDRFRVVIDEGLPIVRSDAVLLQQVFQNLIGNAVKHHDRSAGTIRIEHSQSGSMHEFSVSDDGPGIPGDASGRIFEIFQTVRPKDEVESSGVGLSIVRKAVDALGGSIWLEPSAGRGSTFRVRIPALRDAADRSPQP